MSIQEDKSNVFSNVGVFKVISGLPNKKPKSSLDSVNSKSKNLLPFLTDLLTSTCLDNASDAKSQFRCKMGSIVIDILKESIPKIKSKLKLAVVEAIKSGIVCGSDFKIPQNPKPLEVEVDGLDFNGILTSKNNPIGDLMFSGDKNNDLNRMFKDLASKGVNGNGDSSNWPSSGEPIVNIEYIQPTIQDKPKYIIKIDESRSGGDFNDLLVDYINSVELFNTKTLMSNLVNGLFGLISTSNENSPNKISNKLKLDSSIDKILDVDLCENTVTIDDSFFDFTNEELLSIENESNNLSRGVNVIDLGCDVVEMATPKKTIDYLLEMEGASPTRVEELLDLTLNSLYDGVSEESGGDSTVVKNNFGFNLIKSLPKTVLGLVLSPKVIALYQLTDLTVNNNRPESKNGFDFSKAKRTFFSFMASEILSIFVEIIFNKVKSELISIITNVVNKIIREKLNLYFAAIASVVTSRVSGLLETIELPKK